MLSDFSFYKVCFTAQSGVSQSTSRESLRRMGVRRPWDEAVHRRQLGPAGGRRCPSPPTVLTDFLSAGSVHVRRRGADVCDHDGGRARFSWPSQPFGFGCLVLCS